MEACAGAVTVEPLPLPNDPRFQALIDGWPAAWAGARWPRSKWLGTFETILREHYPHASSDRLTLTARLAAPFALALPGVP
jgi:hypothetical protein